MNRVKLSMIVAVLCFCSCTHSTSTDDVPSWLRVYIAQFESSPSGNTAQVWSYDYKGQTVYYIIAPCCDQFNTLYDASGHILCSPDGGFTGRGDGKCTDFFSERKNERLIWKDPRLQ